MRRFGAAKRWIDVARILISGYYGFGNAGDEAILSSMVFGLRKAIDNADICVVSSNPEQTALHHAVRSVAQLDVAGLLSQIANTDILLSGGGSLLQDVTSVRSLVYYLSLMAAAKAMRKRVMLFANGFGPVNTAQGKALTKIVLNKIDMATFRDKPSYDEVVALGITLPTMEVTADPVFMLEDLLSDERLESARAQAQDALQKSGVPDGTGPLVAVSLRPWKYAAAQFEREVSGALMRLASAGVRVLLLPFHYDQDLEFCERFVPGAPFYVMRERLAPECILELLGMADALLGMRLHSLVFSVCKCVPCAAVSYDPKVTSFAETVGIPVACHATQPDQHSIFNTLSSILTHKTAVASSLAKQRSLQKQSAKRNIEMVTELLR